MSNIWFAGAECGDNSELTSADNSPGSTFVRSGSYCFSFISAGKTLPSDYDELFIQFAIYHNTTLDGSNLACSMRTGSTVLAGITFGADNLIRAYTGNKSTLVGTGTHALSLNAYSVIEIHIKINDTSGVFDVRVNGNSDISFSGDTTSGSETTIDNLVFYYKPGTISNWDDFVVNDITGTINNTWPNCARVARVYPTADGSTHQWTCSAGMTHNILIDECPPSGTDFLIAGTTNLVDEFELTDSPVDASTIFAARAYAIVMKENSQAPNQLALGVKVGTTNYLSTDLDLGVSYGRVEYSWELNPATNDNWTVEDINNLQLVLQSRGS